MGIRSLVKKAAGKAGNAVSKLSSLSPDQLEKIEDAREKYLGAMPSADDPVANELTSRLIAAAGVEIYDAYLPQIDKVYVPAASSVEYGGPFDAAHNERFINITKWVSDPEESSLEKLVNVYDALSNERCNIALVFHRTRDAAQVYLGVIDTENADNNVNVESYIRRLEGALRGNFPGSEWSGGVFSGTIPCLRGLRDVSVASVSNIPTEKSEKFVSQTIEKLLDGVVPRSRREEYAVILLATPAFDVEERKLRLQQLYTGLAPYASWQTNYTYQESESEGSSATVGMNAGLSVGQQAGTNQSLSAGGSVADSENRGVTDSESDSYQQSISESQSDSESHTEGVSDSVSDTDTVGFGVSASSGGSVSAGATVGVPGTGANAEVTKSFSYGMHADTSHAHGKTRGTSSSDTTTQTATKGLSESVGTTTGRAISNTLGRAVTRSLTNTVGNFASANLGGNFGVNFARSSTVTVTIGKNEGITQNHTNYAIKHALGLLEKQMARLEQGSALGLWDFAAYVLSEDVTTASNVAHSYLALTQGEESFMSQASVNLWRGDVSGEDAAQTICEYLRDLRHPLFGLNPDITKNQPNVLPYPAVVTATTTLTGKELARSLNFPRKSVAGLPVFECASFGRNVATFDERPLAQCVRLGAIYHMHRAEPTPVLLDKDSLTSHVLVTGSTGSGKSNAVYRLLEGAVAQGVGFLVVEPAKGEYKDVFGCDEGVSVFGTNPEYAPLLTLDPFSFPKGIHVLEHLDRLIEIFNVCWPMYAAMPAVLKNAVEKAYEDCGWELAASRNPYGDGLYPCFADVARNVREIIDSSEYDTENKGAYKGSLLTRISSLTTGINGMVFSSDEIDASELFDGRTIVDLSRVGSSETKSLLMGVLVLKLQEHRMTQGMAHNSGLRHLTVLEEAHNLLKRTSTEQPAEGGNLLGKSVEMLSNAIAEMRTYGEGFVIADQAPGLLDASVIRNTNTKIVLRLPEGGDRELAGGSEALTDAQVAELARLPRGVAAVYQNDWIEAVLCKIDKAEHGEGRYEFRGSPAAPNAHDGAATVRIAEILCGCTSLTGTQAMDELRGSLRAANLTSCERVRIMRAFADASQGGGQIKALAPCMAILFPSVEKAIEAAYHTSLKADDWSLAAESALRVCGGDDMIAQARRMTIHCLMVHYLINEIQDEQAFRDWMQRTRVV